MKALRDNLVTAEAIVTAAERAAERATGAASVVRRVWGEGSLVSRVRRRSRVEAALHAVGAC